MQFPTMVIGAAIRRARISVFPIFISETSGAVDYRLAQEALSDGTVCVGEVSREGQVDQLSVENKSNEQVLFLEGEQLIGAKQNRIVNASVLMPARGQLRLPVSCAEQGRWSGSDDFVPSDAPAPLCLRMVVKTSVNRSLHAGGGHKADQSRVWDRIASQQRALGIASATQALNDTYVAARGVIDSTRDGLGYPKGAQGIGLGIGRTLRSIDVFDKATTCERFWSRLVTGVVVDALAGGDSAQITGSAVHNFLEKAQNTQWRQTPSVGAGEEQRTDPDTSNITGSALIAGGRMIHLSLCAA